MKHTIRKLIQSKFIRNVAIMATGAAGAQAVTMALSPVITRLYGPEAFGIMGTFTALTGIFISIAALTFPIAIVLPKKDSEAKGIIKLSLQITIIIAILVGLLLLFFNDLIIKLFNLEEIAIYLYLIPIVVVFAGLLQVTEQWLIRTNQFRINAKVNFFQSIIINGSKVGVGLVYPLASVLIVFQVISNGLRALMMIFFAKKSGYKPNEKSEEEIKPSFYLFKKYKEFPVYRAPQVFLASLSESIPILLLTSFFGPAAAGFYSIGRTVLGLPANLIGKSIGDVFYPRISEASNTGENISRLIKKASFGLFAVGIIPFGTIIIFGPWLFDFVFGDGWHVAGDYARWIALAVFARFIGNPATKSMPVLSAQKIHLIYTVVLVITGAIALLIGFLAFNSDIVAVAFFGISSAILNICFLFITLYLSKRFDSKRSSRSTEIK